MGRIKKYLQIISVAYIVLGFVFVATNRLSFTRGVSRHPINPACANTATLSTNNDSFSCAETADLRWGYHFTWVSWRFFSNNRGYDDAKYIPADLILLALVNSGVYLVSRKNRSKRQ